MRTRTRRSIGDSSLDQPRARRRWRVLWQQRGAPIWRDFQWLVIAAVAVLMLLLGYIGFDRLPGPSSSLDSLYRTIQLFWLQSGDVSGEAGRVPVSLQIARFGAPLIAGYAAVRAVASLLGEQVLLLAIKSSFGNHVVVAGLGSTGFRLATALHDRGWRVVVIDRDVSNALAAGCRERAIPVVWGDAKDAAVLRATRVSRACYLFVCCGDDNSNLDVLMSAASLGGSRHPAIFAHLDDLELWRLIRAEAFASTRRFGARVEFFNLAELAARRIAEEHPVRAGDEGQDGRPPHIAVVGSGPIADAFVLHAARQSLEKADGQAPVLRVTLVGRDAETQRSGLLQRHARLRGACEISATTTDSCALEDRITELLSETGSAISGVYVFVTPETDGLSVALAIHRHPSIRCGKIVVVVRDEEAGVGSLLKRGLERPGAIDVYGLETRALDPSLVVNGTIEAVARAMHEDYVRSQGDRGATPDDNPSLVPWEALPEALKESNRRFAEDVRQKLEIAQCVLVPDPLAPIERSRFSFANEEIEDLGRLEHARWVADLRRDGWRSGDGTRDPVRKLHPLLVDWERLEEKEREKDRDAVRALPELLARAGFEIRRRGEEPKRAAGPRSAR